MRERDRARPELLAHLRGGADLALVTDAGTPGVSDPGADLVAAWAAEGGRVCRSRARRPSWRPCRDRASPGRAGRSRGSCRAPGVSGGNGRGDRRRPPWDASSSRRRSGGRDAPDLAAACGEDRAGAVARELTKIHEQIERGTLGTLRLAVESGRIPKRGEFVIVVGWERRRAGRRRAAATSSRPGQRSNDSSARAWRAARPRDAWRPIPVCRADSLRHRGGSCR